MLRRLTTCLPTLLLAAPLHAAPVEFNRDVRPILSEFCFACHGPDSAKRKADLRLDVPGGVPDDLVARLTHADPKKRMPPASTGKQLSAARIDTLRRWVAEGAAYQPHWSFVTPRRPALPPVRDGKWPRNPIDRFVLARLEAERLPPSAEADRRTLLRRLSFDLLGLPTPPDEIDAFLADKSEKSYENAVERLLTSRHHGERLALMWLDLVRFADTGGYHSDNHRDVYLFRDYVIEAFNKNKPFDRFTLEQLAGDLLDKPTSEQRVASGYNRMLMTTEEGGAQAKEYLAKYAADRVRNAGSVWLGLTIGCAECHNHKFDPVTTKEFYQFASFWADIQEVAVGRQPQTRVGKPPEEAELKRVERELAEAQANWEQSIDKDNLPKAVAAALAVAADKRKPAQRKTIADHYATIPAEREKLAALRKRQKELERVVPQTLVSMAGPPRAMRVLPRGNWLDDSGEIVAPNTPASLPRLNIAKDRPTRRDLAKWMTSADHPLTARVFVNRLWKLFFGQGLVTSMEDFGAQGAWPSHPELLDWLAVEFVESGWDVRHMVRLMVTSAAYRQTSRVSDPLKQHDPYNRLLGRQARFRLDAELVRDNALAVSGLLSRRVGGESAKPYQPAGYWAYLNFPKRDWVEDKGDSQYRRGLYTYVQRTFPHPSLLAFDAPSREECTADRPRSNTPQQALVLLNDPTYVEAARALAALAMKRKDDDRLTFIYRRALGRSPSDAESDVLRSLFARHLEQYRADPASADALLSVGHAADNDGDRPALAAWTSVARVVLNLHETITRE